MRWSGVAVLVVSFALVAWEASAQNDKTASQEFARGLAAMSRGDLVEAEQRFKEVVTLDPVSFEARNNLAVIYAEQGKYDAAVEQLKGVLALRPAYYRGRKNLAELYARMANDAFQKAAEVAPPEDKEKLATRARLIGAPPGSGATGAIAGGVLEPAGGPPAPAMANAPAATTRSQGPTASAPSAPPPAAAPLDMSPGVFVSLTEGAPGIVATDAGLRIHRQLGGGIKPAERIPVKQVLKLPLAPTFYVAVPGEGRVDLVPLERGGRALTIRDGGQADIVVDAQAFAVMRDAVDPNLSPVVVAASLAAADPKVVEDKRNAVIAAFKGWAESWQSKDLEGYLASYVSDYNPRGGPGAQKWKEQRAKVFERSGDISVSLSTPIVLDGGNQLVTLTRQEYRSKLQSSVGVKKLTWSSTPQGWKIAGEEMLSEKIQKSPG